MHALMILNAEDRFNFRLAEALRRLQTTCFAGLSNVRQ
jgi:hypothetical protein